MKRWIGVALILVPFLAPAASFWDGNAGLQRGDAVFEGGMFGASNSFAPETLVLVRNLETGKTAAVTITKRVEGESDILVLLSPRAASALGIAAGTLASVRVTLQQPAAVQGAPLPSDQDLSQDPDLNPAASYAGPEPAAETTTPAVAAEQPAPLPSMESLASTAAPATEQAAVPASTPEAPAPEQPASTQIATTAGTGTSKPQAAQDAAAPSSASEDARKAAEDAAILADAAARTPQKRVFLPPREDKLFAYVPPAPAPVETPVTQTAQAAPAEPQITAVIGEPDAAPAAAPQESPALAEAAAPQESRPEEIVGAEAVQPAQTTGSAEVALAAPQPLGAEEQPAAAPEPVQTEVTAPPAAPPEAPAPAAVALLVPAAPEPEKAPAAALQDTTPVQQATTPVVVAAGPATTRQPAAQSSRPAEGGTWFVQLAAYASEKGAQELATTLSPTFPALVIPPAATGTRMFRVVVGPLNRAESGTLLVWFRFRGFPDAFVKQE